MSKTLKIITSFAIIIGWLLGGIGFTTKVGHPISTILLLTGIACLFFGLIGLIISIKSKSTK